jgi:hypothetical protein
MRVLPPTLSAKNAEKMAAILVIWKIRKTRGATLLPSYGRT